MRRLFASIALLSVSFAQADETFDYTKRWGIGGSLGYNTPVFGNPFNKAADGGETWGVHGRYHFTQQYGVEAAFTRHEFKDTNSALQVTDLLVFKRLAPVSRFSPVIGAGAGVVDVTHYDPSSLKLGLKARAGAEYALSQCLSLGLNVDYQHVNKMLFAANLPGRNVHALAARIGLTWYFGHKAEKADAPAPAKSTPVAAAAAPMDSDNDGVMDQKDKCPQSAPGEKVNAYGCAEAEKATVKLNVQFQSGKSTIAPGYDADLKEIAAFMSEHATTKVEIQGHTDNSGSKALNKTLSQKRADAVKAALVKLGVAADRLTAKGYGDEQPVADNATAEGKQQNRRVVAVISE